MFLVTHDHLGLFLDPRWAWAWTTYGQQPIFPSNHWFFAVSSHQGSAIATSFYIKSSIELRRLNNSGEKRLEIDLNSTVFIHVCQLFVNWLVVLYYHGGWRSSFFWAKRGHSLKKLFLPDSKFLLCVQVALPNFWGRFSSPRKYCVLWYWHYFTPRYFS